MQTLSLLLAAALFAAPAAAVAAAADHSGHGAPSDKAAPVAAMADGEVRRIDSAAGSVTLRHGPIANLGMPAMTMTFAVIPRGVLDKLKVGDKVKFVAEDRSGNTVITKIEPAR